MINIEFLSLFVLISGFIIGLGAVNVIDLHGLLGRHSKYWTEATTRTHKVTKPLIWIGIFLVLFGGSIFYYINDEIGTLYIHIGIILILIINGIFLSFSVSPYLLKREREGRQSEILPKNWQNKITISFIFSFIGWWSLVLILVYNLVK